MDMNKLFFRLEDKKIELIYLKRLMSSRNEKERINCTPDLKI